jgi:hypothetical protein
MKTLRLLFLLFLPQLVLAQQAPIVLADQNVAAGGALDSGVLNLADLKISEVSVVVDSTAGTAMRQLTMTSYLPNGTTVIDSVPLRLVAFGAAPTGSVYAPGRVRGYVGPNPPGGTSGKYALWSDTSAANTALSSPTLYAEDCDSVQMFAVQNTGGATTTCMLRPTLENGTPNHGWINPQTSVTSGPCAIVQAFGAVAGLGGQNVAGEAGVSASPFRRFVTTTGASSVGTTTTEVVCTGRVPGTFSVQMLLPPKASFNLAAGGSGAARMTVIGYKTAR